MPPKKAKVKGKKKVDLAAKAEELRLIELHQQENIAEEEQRSEDEKRKNNELAERIILWKDEQLSQQRSKDKQIDTLHKELEEITSRSREEKVKFTLKLEELQLADNSLKKEVSLLREENLEKEQLRARERENHGAQVQKLQIDYENQIKSLEESNELLQSQLHSNLIKLEKTEEEKTIVQLESTEAAKQMEEEVNSSKRELENALTMNKHLQVALEEHEIDDKKNVTLMHLLNTQLEEERRRHEDVLEEEKIKCNRFENELQEIVGKFKSAESEVSELNRKIREITTRTEKQIREYEEKMEQVKYDSQYLQNEIQSMKLESETNSKIADEIRQTSSKERESLLFELESNQKRVEEMESMLCRKEREYCDKLTFMNAQLVNSRSTILQLQQKLEAERNTHNEELERQLRQVEDAFSSMHNMQNMEKSNELKYKEREEKFLRDISILSEELKLLKNSIAVEEETNAKVLQEKTNEIQRLQELLDANFVPHRKEVEVVRMSSKLDEITLLRDKLHDAQKELQIKESAFAETEQWWKAQLKLQSEMIEELQKDLKKSEMKRLSECQEYENEIACLKKTLDIHFIPYTAESSEIDIIVELDNTF